MLGVSAILVIHRANSGDDKKSKKIAKRGCKRESEGIL
nr:MAG TPA: hypothetical protein [Podoviridae sp. ctK5Q1]